MPEKLLICTDLDRTLIPNGPQPESSLAREYFCSLTDRPEVALTYVSGRHMKLVQQAINQYGLPYPDFIIGDVGTTLYHIKTKEKWERLSEWEEKIAADWGGKTHADLKGILHDIHALRPQESDKQNDHKLSYYVPLQINHDAITTLVKQRFSDAGIKSRLIWSVDEFGGTGLLDILPKSASKYHAIEALMQIHGFSNNNTVFCGDSGNDIDVLASEVPAVLVANSQPEVQDLAKLLATEKGFAEQLYIAQGGFLGLNGNYSAGMLEGIAHYYPWTKGWMKPDESEQAQ